ncbi:type II secretion system F family protein [Anaerovorax odorimutans]|uniref:type II secretion system F family protein n=1 Tax=Anaerovorax odorimutans TaxID=109327 RepID=UPI0003F6D159|nr:type II secretion system F family protein [Anaerovorax odorimutans]
MVFNYKAVNEKGKKKTGQINADDKAAAVSMLKNQGFVPITITQVNNKISQNNNFEKLALQKKKLSEIEVLEKDIHKVKIKKKKILSILNQFAIMMRAGVSLSLCMEVLLEQEKDRQLKKILQEIKSDMYSGQTLSSSMVKFKAFNQIIINIISAGEVNGRLDMAFERAAKIMENEIKITSKVKNSLSYPLFLLIITIVVVIIMNIVVLPIFSDMFSNMGAELPLITRMVIGSSTAIIHYWYLIVLTVLLITFSYIYSRKRFEDFKIETDRLILKIPLIGNILIKMYIARFCRVMASLVEAGVELVYALKVSSDIVPNSYVKRSLEKVRDDVKVGIAINQAMSKLPVFDSLLVSMIRVGEESGMLFDVLDKMADMLETQTEEKTKQLTALLEPSMTIIIALLVGTVVISVVIPMFGQYKLMM